MFDLEQPIAEWRKQMLAAGIKTPVPLEELESHLREEIERQMRAGSNAQVAFNLAVEIIGNGQELKTEFSKERRLRAILTMELLSKESGLKWGPVLNLVVWTGIFLFFGSMELFKTGGFSEITPVERVSSLAATAVGCLLAYGGPLGYKFFPVIPARRVRLAICACGTVLVSASTMFWMLGFLRHLDISVAQVPIGFSWAGQFLPEFLWAFFVPMGALHGLIFGLERAAYKKGSNAVAN